MTRSPCDNCGLCCRQLIIEIQHADVVREPKLLPVVTLAHSTCSRPCNLSGEPIYDDVWDKEYILARGRKQPCPMLGSDQRCTIYATRPNACVMFEAGGDHCNELRMDNGMKPIDSSGAELPLCGCSEGCAECDYKGYVRQDRLIEN